MCHDILHNIIYILKIVISLWCGSEQSMRCDIIHMLRVTETASSVQRNRLKIVLFDAHLWLRLNRFLCSDFSASELVFPSLSRCRWPGGRHRCVRQGGIIRFLREGLIWAPQNSEPFRLLLGLFFLLLFEELVMKNGLYVILWDTWQLF